MRTPKDIFQVCRDFKEADRARASGLYPYFRTIEGMDAQGVICNGRRQIMVGSNNYLGLANDPRVVEAGCDAARRFGAGCTGSRFLNGTLSLHEELEAALAEFLDRESVLLFSTGFFANQGALTTLLDAADVILCDRENHASILDGSAASAARLIPFPHNSAEGLDRRLQRLGPETGKLVIADGVFSMSGDLFDLPAMERVSRKHGARLYVDEAHSLGVFGPNGEGVAHHFGLNGQVDLVMGTFSKSLGSMGGFLAGPAYVIDYLKHRARCFMFTASLAPSVVGSVLKALELMGAEPERREQLWKNTKKMHEGFREMGFNIGSTQSPIVPLMVGSEHKAFELSHRLLEAGIFTTPAVYPAVRYGEAIVRTSYMATHSEVELDTVLETCRNLAKELAIFDEPVYTGEKRRRINSGYDFRVQERKESAAV